MNIAIIGSGNVGGAVARSATRAGHAVTIGSADRSGANEVAGATSARVAVSNREAVGSAEIAILALPADAIPEVASEPGEALAGKIVIDVVNRPTPDPSRPECTSHAEELQAMLPDALVVKAFNTLFASRQSEPALGGDTADAYVAGDDASAKRTVFELVESMGFVPFDVGGLVVARTLEGMAWLHISLAMHNNWTWQSAWKLVGPKGA